MLDKSPEILQDNDCAKIRDEFESNILNIILYSNPFHKIEFLNKLIDSIKNPIIFLDIDFLYTGYVKSEMIQKKPNVTILHPDKTTWKQKMSDTISKISEEKFLVIIDSLNGIYNMYDSIESTISVNSCIMLLSSLGYKKDSCVIVTGMARKKEEGGAWALSPGGKQIIKSSKSRTYFLKKPENNLILDSLEDGNKKAKAFKIM